MMPLSGPHKGSVLTVAKASVDFFASEFGDFRAEHFVQFDLQSVEQVEIRLSTSFVEERELGSGGARGLPHAETLAKSTFGKGDSQMNLVSPFQKSL